MKIDPVDLGGIVRLGEGNGLWLPRNLGLPSIQLFTPTFEACLLPVFRLFAISTYCSRRVCMVAEGFASQQAGLNGL